MNSRTRLLLGATIVMGLAVFGDRGYRKLVEEPKQKLQRDLSRVEKQIDVTQDVIFRSAEAGDRVHVLEKYSLPFDEEMARARYQDWLLGLVEEADLQQPTVDSGAAIPVTIKDPATKKAREVYKRYSFSVRGRGSLQQITQLLYEFYQGGHLHKVTTLTLNPVSGGSSLDLTMGIEALGVTTCEREVELSRIVADRLHHDDLKAYESIVKRNLFFHRSDGVLQRVVLTAITFDRTGLPAAWFSLGDNQPTRVIRREGSLTVQEHEIQVIDIQPQLVLIELDGRAVKLPLGKSVHEMTAPLAQAD